MLHTRMLKVMRLVLVKHERSQLCMCLLSPMSCYSCMGPRVVMGYSMLCGVGCKGSVFATPICLDGLNLMV